MNKRLIITQLFVVLIVVIVAWVYRSTDGALAAFYGGMIAVTNTILLARRVTRAGEVAKTDPKHSVYILYFGAIERFVFALIALGVGLSLLKLDAIPLLAAFGLAQLAYILPNQSTTKL